MGPVAILAEVAVPCCRLAWELGGYHEDAEGANHESSHPMAAGKKRIAAANSMANESSMGPGEPRRARLAWAMHTHTLT